MLVLALNRWAKALCAAVALLSARRVATRGKRALKASAAVDALERSTVLLAKATRGKSIDVAAYTKAVEALLPAFSAYGRIFDSAARKDVLGNVNKLRKRSATLKKKEARAMVLRERELDPAMTDAPDSAARALFWINRIIAQVAASFENLLDRPRASFTRCATDAYLATCAPYNQPAHRTMARIMLKIIPDRDAFVRMYGGSSMGDLEPTLRAWVKASKNSRRNIDDFFAKQPDLAPRRRTK